LLIQPYISYEFLNDNMAISIERKITINIRYEFIIGVFKSLASYSKVFFDDQLWAYIL